MEQLFRLSIVTVVISIFSFCIAYTLGADLTIFNTVLHYSGSTCACLLLINLLFGFRAGK